MALIGKSEDILEYTPAYSNLYTVTFGEDSDTSTTKFNAVDVVFGDESLSFVRNAATTYFTLKEGAYKRNDTLSITWRESDGYKIKKLHMEWLDLFYDTTTDKYRSIPLKNGSKDEDEIAKRYKTIRVDVRSSDDPKQSTKFTFKCLPSNIGNLHLAWGTTPSVVTYTINYYVEDWKME